MQSPDCLCPPRGHDCACRLSGGRGSNPFRALRRRRSETWCGRGRAVRGHHAQILMSASFSGERSVLAIGRLERYTADVEGTAPETRSSAWDAGPSGFSAAAGVFSAAAGVSAVVEVYPDQ
eukprot:3829957-Prymnesium_polylepis.2